MKQIQQFTAVIEREDDDYVSLCPELDIASQGDTVEEARNNLIEAIELFLKPLILNSMGHVSLAQPAN